MQDTPSGLTPASPHLAQLVSAFELFAGASSAIERQHAELTTHLDKLRQDLGQANERLSVLIKALPAAVLLVEDGLVTHYNDAAQRLISPLQTQMPWKLPDSWVPGDGPNEFRTGDGQQARTMQVQQNHSQGRVVVQIQDITDNLRTLEENERVSRLAAMGKMSAGIAHQLRTPLSTALLYAAHLSNEQLQTEDRRQFSSRLQEQLLKLEKLAGQMLQFIKPGLQQTQPLNIDDLARQVVAQVSGLSLRHGILIEQDFQTADALIEAERASLEAALVAILENAIQVSTRGQSVQVSTRQHPHRVEITIEDNGPGISSEMMGNLFEPFATDRISGTGLGLSIASNTIRRHRGDIMAENRPEGGARFTVALPCITQFEDHP